MAFVTPTPLLSSSSSSSSSPHRSLVSRAPVVLASAGPKPPPNFTAPTPRTFRVRPDKLSDIVSLSLGQALRLGTSFVVDGYRVRSSDGAFTEYSTTLPATRPARPLHIFEFEACPFCRKVREAVSILDLDVIFFPCPRDGTVYRDYVLANGGKAQFPYVEDPNTNFSSYESQDIIDYLYKTYGPPSARPPITLSPAFVPLVGLASSVRSNRGRKRAQKTVPAKRLLQLWGYEASPFVKLVRETLNELELPHLYYSTARGSPTRQSLKDSVGRFQVPYLIDPNTGVAMFESADICDYLVATYGTDAVGAVDRPDQSDVYMPGDPIDGAPPKEPSLDPVEQKDQALEQYCEDNPDADECRVYED